MTYSEAGLSVRSLCRCINPLDGKRSNTILDSSSSGIAPSSSSSSSLFARVSRRVGDGFLAPASQTSTTTVAMSTRPASRAGTGLVSRLKQGTSSDGDSKALVPLLVAGVTVAGALAFVYCHPAGQKWRKRVFGDCSGEEVPRAVTTLGSTMAAESDMRGLANDRALKNLGVRELNLGFLPEGAKIVNLPNQVGGHKMMKAMPALLLLEWEGKGPQGGSRRFVLKILHDGGRGLVELGFYENLARRADDAASLSEKPQHAELAGIICPYFGAVKVSTDAHIDDDGAAVEGSSFHFLVLQDMCSGFTNACALDVKMGRVTVEPGERESKKIGQLKKYPNQPMTGFRYVGMSWWSHAEGDEQPEKVSMGKDWGADMEVEDCGAGFAKFFHDGTTLRRGRVMCALRKIRAVTDFFARQKIFRFYASSLLLTYDSGDPAPVGDEEEEVHICMIDFAHAVPMDGDGEQGEGPAEAPADKGYLYGANNLVGILEDLLEVTASSGGAPIELEAVSAKLTYMSKVKANYRP